MKNGIPVAITEMGCLSAAGLNLPENMFSLFKGVRHAAPPMRFTSTHPSPYPVFEIQRDPALTCAAQNKRISRTCRLGIMATLEAIEDAVLKRDDLAEVRTGVCIGTTVGCAMNNEEFYGQYLKGSNPDMAVIKDYLNSNPATVIAREFGLTGPCQTIVNACSSGTDAIGMGASWIRAGLCDRVIAGGADELCRVTYNGFISLMITDPSPCKPFDQERKGLNLGEGAAILILESEDAIRKRGKTPRSFVLGYGSACDGYHLTAPSPDGLGLRRAIDEAMTQSRVSIEDIAFMNAHGTATSDNDRVEATVLKEMLPGVPFFSTKGYTGHTLGAAGAIEAAFTVACLEEGKIPGNAGFHQPDPELEITPITQTQTIRGTIALSESLAFGGHNSVLVLSRKCPEKAEALS